MRAAVALVRAAVALMRAAVALVRVAVALVRVAVALVRVAVAFVRVAVAFVRVALALVRVAVALVRVAVCTNPTDAVGGSFIPHLLLNSQSVQSHRRRSRWFVHTPPTPKLPKRTIPPTQSVVRSYPTYS